MNGHYIVEQNPKYLVRYENSEKVGLRNKNGIVALKPEYVSIRRKSFSDSESLEDLLKFLEKRGIKNILY